MITTPNLNLIPCELKHFEAILNDPSVLASLLGVTVFENWFDFPGVAGIEAITHSYNYLKAHPEATGWWMYLFIHREDNSLIGYGGYKGKADAEGMVEIGYAIIDSYRCRGLASDAAQGLVDHAFRHDHVLTVDAHTLPERNASVRVLEKIGMKHVGTASDPDVGEVWHWRLERDEWRERT
ncbi:MAG: GNAT family N-acetyltransferase [Blastocatellia bacterium]|nr:MAG: GNAT family N-acetyltransferase [Blastocatellia bacterium]